MKQIKLFCDAFLGNLENKVNEFLSNIYEKNVVDVRIIDSNGYFTAMVIFLADEDYKGEA